MSHLKNKAIPGVDCAGVPLSSCALFETRDLDDARERVARVYCDHRLDLIGQGSVLARHNRLPGATLSINFMEYGAKSLIVPGALDTFYLFQFPLNGFATVTNGADTYTIGSGRGGVLNPDVETSMIWEADCAQLLVQIDSRTLNRLARRHFGLPEERIVHFKGTGDLSTGKGRSVLELLLYIIREAELGNVVIGTETMLARQLEETLILGLLEYMPNSLHGDETRAGRGRGPAPRLVRQAESYMEAHLTDSVTVSEICEAVGTSLRSLQTAFRLHRDRTPLEVLRDMRLERAWIDLSNPTSETRVTDVATEWGFFHLGRFAEQYRRKFGCTPVETLRQALDQ
ncbi:AraC family transcriptional regulator [Phaeobacter sp. HF9A]|uniref:AraC family transcriptional regulator n=1 Tax=Phaeobacter sp. HF9A TaxID=2721561 RepID=UPI00142FFD6B|nr:AraC family transcriptional regulator [Phaeobacter sp. HF9A]